MKGRRCGKGYVSAKKKCRATFGRILERQTPGALRSAGIGPVPLGGIAAAGIAGGAAAAALGAAQLGEGGHEAVTREGLEQILEPIEDGIRGNNVEWAAVIDAKTGQVVLPPRTDGQIGNVDIPNGTLRRGVIITHNHPDIEAGDGSTFDGGSFSVDDIRAAIDNEVEIRAVTKQWTYSFRVDWEKLDGLTREKADKMIAAEIVANEAEAKEFLKGSLGILSIESAYRAEFQKNTLSARERLLAGEKFEVVHETTHQTMLSIAEQFKDIVTYEARRRIPRVDSGLKTRATPRVIRSCAQIRGDAIVGGAQPDGSYIIDDSELYTKRISAACTFCKHWVPGTRSCRAFASIPDPIWNGEDGHTSFVLGDGGVKFEPIEGAPLTQIEAYYGQTNPLPRTDAKKSGRQRPKPTIKGKRCGKGFIASNLRCNPISGPGRTRTKAFARKPQPPRPLPKPSEKYLRNRPSHSREGIPYYVPKTPAEKALYQVEREIRNNPFESLYVYKPTTGEVVFAAKGSDLERYAVTVPSWVAETEGLVTVHNHPNPASTLERNKGRRLYGGGDWVEEVPAEDRPPSFENGKGVSFSYPDIEIALSHKAAEVRVVTSGYVFSAKRTPQTGVPRGQNLRKIYDAHYSEAEVEVMGRVRKGEMTFSQAGEELTHRAAERTCRSVGMEYTRHQWRDPIRPGADPWVDDPMTVEAYERGKLLRKEEEEMEAKRMKEMISEKEGERNLLAQREADEDSVYQRIKSGEGVPSEMRDRANVLAQAGRSRPSTQAVLDLMENDDEEFVLKRADREAFLAGIGEEYSAATELGVANAYVREMMSMKPSSEDNPYYYSLLRKALEQAGHRLDSFLPLPRSRGRSTLNACAQIRGDAIVGGPQPDGSYVIDDSELYTKRISAACTFCKHWVPGTRSCRAFASIPDPIWNGEDGHTSFVLGDGGVKFEPIEGAPLTQVEAYYGQASPLPRTDAKKSGRQRPRPTIKGKRCGKGFIASNLRCNPIEPPPTRRTKAPSQERRSPKPLPRPSEKYIQGRFSHTKEGIPYYSPTTPGEKALFSIETSIRNSSWENGAAYDPSTGEVLGPIQGTSHSVGVPAEWRNRDLVFTHNHPGMNAKSMAGLAKSAKIGSPQTLHGYHRGGGSFSDGDIKALFSYGFSEIRAVDRGYVHSLKMTASTRERWSQMSEIEVHHEIEMAVSTAGYEAAAELMGQVREGEMPLSIAGRDWSHARMEKTASSIGLDYSRKAYRDAPPEGEPLSWARTIPAETYEEYSRRKSLEEEAEMEAEVKDRERRSREYEEEERRKEKEAKKSSALDVDVARAAKPFRDLVSGGPNGDVAKDKLMEEIGSDSSLMIDRIVSQFSPESSFQQSISTVLGMNPDPETGRFEVDRATEEMFANAVTFQYRALQMLGLEDSYLADLLSRKPSHPDNDRWQRLLSKTLKQMEADGFIPDLDRFTQYMADSYFRPIPEPSLSTLRACAQIRADAVFLRDLERNERGQVKYQGEWYTPNEPKPATQKGKKRQVLATKEGKAKLVAYGAKGYKHNYSEEAKANYLKRAGGIRDKSGKKTKDDKFSANYWAMKDLWPRNEPADGSAKNR